VARCGINDDTARTEADGECDDEERATAEEAPEDEANEWPREEDARVPLFDVEHGEARALAEFGHDTAFCSGWVEWHE
jgi:hypothetical protein